MIHVRISRRNAPCGCSRNLCGPPVGAGFPGVLVPKRSRVGATTPGGAAEGFLLVLLGEGVAQGVDVIRIERSHSASSLSTRSTHS